jgi:hypothetical protein
MSLHIETLRDVESSNKTPKQEESILLKIVLTKEGAIQMGVPIYYNTRDEKRLKILILDITYK